MNATAARANPQQFIDYLSTSDKVLWHFINDPFWGHPNCPIAPNWGWCGSVQANFLGSLRQDFPFYDFKRLTFKTLEGGIHTVTWFSSIIIDTMFNLLICDNKRYSLTEIPIITPYENDIQHYYYNKLVELNFLKVNIIHQKNYKRKELPPFLS